MPDNDSQGDLAPCFLSDLYLLNVLHAHSALATSLPRCSSKTLGTPALAGLYFSPWLDHSLPMFRDQLHHLLQAFALVTSSVSLPKYCLKLKSLLLISNIPSLYLVILFLSFPRSIIYILIFYILMGLYQYYFFPFPQLRCKSLRAAIIVCSCHCYAEHLE